MSGAIFLSLLCVILGFACQNVCGETVDELTRKLQELEGTVKALQAQIPVRKNINGSAFSAYLSEDETLLSDTVILFDVVTVNEGNGYSPSFGFFQCLATGVYFFSIHISSPAASESEVKLVKEGTTEETLLFVKTYMSDPVDNSGVHSGNTVVSCSQGERVFVRVISDEPETKPVRLLGRTYTMFSGFQL